MIRDQVKQFHEAMGLPVGSSPAVPADDRVRLRLRLILEEFFELLDSVYAPDSLGLLQNLSGIMLGFVESAKVSVYLVGAVDALADLDYVIEGTRLEFGVDGRSIAAEVHAANMRKIGGQMRQDGKVLKPVGWRGPDIEGVLRQQGWKP